MNDEDTDKSTTSNSTEKPRNPLSDSPSLMTSDERRKKEQRDGGRPSHGSGQRHRSGEASRKPSLERRMQDLENRILQSDRNHEALKKKFLETSQENTELLLEILAALKDLELVPGESRDDEDFINLQRMVERRMNEEAEEVRISKPQERKKLPTWAIGGLTFLGFATTAAASYKVGRSSGYNAAKKEMEEPQA